MLCEFEYRGRKIQYELERKPVKNMNLRVRPDGFVHLSVNYRVSERTAMRFVESRAEWICSALQKYQNQVVRILTERYREGETVFYLGNRYQLKLSEGMPDVCCIGEQMVIFCHSPEQTNEKEIQRIYLKWYENRCHTVFREAFERVFPLFSVYGLLHKPNLCFRYMRSRWGSCNVRENKITLNKHLLKVPAEYIDFVIAHELTHCICPDHSQTFYQLLEKIVPDSEQKRIQLNRYLIL